MVDKIELFIDRVENWHLGVAREMIRSDLPNRDFAILMLIMNYFEMIAKYRDGYVQQDKGRRKGEGRSAHYFKEGLKDVFPDMALPEDEAVAVAIYESVRNGLYHAGGTRSNVVIAEDAPNTVGYNTQTGQLAIVPDRLVWEVERHFQAYAQKLRSAGNAKLRANFEARFDVDNE